MTATPLPSLIALAGPNGAGKSTAGPTLLTDTLGVTAISSENAHSEH